MEALFASYANSIKQFDPVRAISHLCGNGDVTPEHAKDAGRMLNLELAGWLDTKEQVRETLYLCALVRMEWDSDAKQQPATAAMRLMEKGNTEESALLLGFAPAAERLPLLVRVLGAMLQAPHMSTDDMACMFGAQ